MACVCRDADFVLQYKTEIIPVEVKVSEKKSAPSFKRYIAAHRLRYALWFSKQNYRKDGSILNISVYLVRRVNKLL